MLAQRRRLRIGCNRYPQPPCYRNRETNITTALFSIRLHFVRRERIGIVQISASQFLTTRLRRTLSKIAKVYPRHCERSEAIHVSTCGPTDCFAALAMASRSRSPDERSDIRDNSVTRDPGCRCAHPGYGSHTTFAAAPDKIPPAPSPALPLAAPSAARRAAASPRGSSAPARSPETPRRGRRRWSGSRTRTDTVAAGPARMPCASACSAFSPKPSAATRAKPPEAA